MTLGGFILIGGGTILYSFAIFNCRAFSKGLRDNEGHLGGNESETAAIENLIPSETTLRQILSRVQDD